MGSRGKEDAVSLCLDKAFFAVGAAEEQASFFAVVEGKDGGGDKVRAQSFAVLAVERGEGVGGEGDGAMGSGGEEEMGIDARGKGVCACAVAKGKAPVEREMQHRGVKI